MRPRVSFYETTNNGKPYYQIRWKGHDGRWQKRSSYDRAKVERVAEELEEQIASGEILFRRVSPATKAAIGIVMAKLGGEERFLELMVGILGNTATVDAPRTPEICDRYVAQLKEWDKSKKYVFAMRNLLNKFVQAFGSKPFGTIQPEDISEWLADKYPTPATRKVARAMLIACYKWAKQKGWLDQRADTPAQRSDSVRNKSATKIEIYTPAELRALFRAIEPRYAPFLAIKAFAGLRTAEMLRMSWARNVKDDAVVVDGDIAKTMQRRVISPMPAALRAWLDQSRPNDDTHPTPNVAEWGSAFKAAREKAGVPLKPNGMRHAFVSYYYALNEDAGATVKAAGHSETMMRTHYLHLATKDDAREWFDTHPGNTLNESGEHA